MASNNIIYTYIYIHIFTPDLLHINIRKGVEISENVPRRDSKPERWFHISRRIVKID